MNGEVTCSSGETKAFWKSPRPSERSPNWCVALEEAKNGPGRLSRRDKIIPSKDYRPKKNILNEASRLKQGVQSGDIICNY